MMPGYYDPKDMPRPERLKFNAFLRLKQRLLTYHRKIERYEIKKYLERSNGMALEERRAYYADKFADPTCFDIVAPGPDAQAIADRKGRAFVKLVLNIRKQNAEIDELYRRYLRDCVLLDLNIIDEEEEAHVCDAQERPGQLQDSVGVVE